MMTSNDHLFQEALQHFPGGVNSPVRAFAGVGGTPIFFEKGQAACVYDAQGKAYIDYVCSWGPAILGHAHPKVTQALQQKLQNGLSFGAPTQAENALAQKIKSFMPNLEKMRFVSSGTEATMSAIRLARGYTGRNKILKFKGCYHGHYDALLVQAGSGLLTCGIPSSKGIPEAFAAHTLVADFNDLDSVSALFETYGQDIAAIIVEPIAANMNLVLPKTGFLEGLRQICDKYQSVLIFDEVITGFRVAKGGAQALYNIKPDLTTLGKIVGGGLPVGVFGGKAEIMAHLAPVGAVYQAGTLSGNPLAMTAGLSTLEILEEAGTYENLTQNTAYLAQGLQEIALAAKTPFLINQLTGLMGLYFTDQNQIEDFSSVQKSDVARYQSFFHAMLNQGIYFAPSAFETVFVSLAHDKTCLDKTLSAFEKALNS